MGPVPGGEGVDGLSEGVQPVEVRSVIAAGGPTGVHAEGIGHVAGGKGGVLERGATGLAMEVVDDSDAGGRGAVRAVVNELGDGIVGKGGKKAAVVGIAVAGGIGPPRGTLICPRAEWGRGSARPAFQKHAGTRGDVPPSSSGPV